MQNLTTLLFVIVGLINFIPIVGAISGARLESMYSITLSDPNLVVLMRHRALLLGIVGSILLYAAFTPSARGLAIIAGFASMVSYVILAWTADESNAALVRVQWIDVVAALLLALAWVLDRWSKTPS